MIVAGLTGSIGMGKSTVAHHLRNREFPVIDADKIVHNLYAGEAAPLIEAAFPGSTTADGVDRGALASLVVGNPDALTMLESIVHPLVRKRETQALVEAQANGACLAIIEIPLLFETGSHDMFDAIIVVSAPQDVQHERVLARPGMSPEKLDAILARQWPDPMKREKADYVVNTGLSLHETLAEVDNIVADLLKKSPRAFQRWKPVKESD